MLGAPRPGRKLALLGDSCDSSRAAALCASADVIVHEATLANEMKESALEKGHSTPGELHRGNSRGFYLGNSWGILLGKFRVDFNNRFLGDFIGEIPGGLGFY